MAFTPLAPTTEISIHAPREGGDGTPAPRAAFASISIHAPREGGDVTYRRYDDYASYISIHAPREGGDLTVNNIGRIRMIFQSTPPARGATRLLGALGLTAAISIHAPREGGDPY